MSEDHLIVAQRVGQQPTDNASLTPMVEKVKLECGSPPGQVLVDSGYFSLQNLQWLEQQNISAYLPDSNMARAMNLGKKCQGRARKAVHRRMRQKLRSPQGRQAYAQRKAIVELGFVVFNEHFMRLSVQEKGAMSSRWIPCLIHLQEIRGISLVFGEMWDSTALTRRLFAAVKDASQYNPLPSS